MRPKSSTHVQQTLLPWLRALRCTRKDITTHYSLRTPVLLRVGWLTSSSTSSVTLSRTRRNASTEKANAWPSATSRVRRTFHSRRVSAAPCYPAFLLPWGKEEIYGRMPFLLSLEHSVVRASMPVLALRCRVSVWDRLRGLAFFQRLDLTPPCARVAVCARACVVRCGAPTALFSEQGVA